MPLGALTTIYFVRHGHVHNPDQVLYGRLPGFSLSDEGRHQAEATAEFLKNKPIAAIFSSPQERAQETAQIILACHNGLQCQIDPLLSEVHTVFEGRPISEVAARSWDVYTQVEPLREGPSEILGRLQRFMDIVRCQYGQRHVVAVTHGDPIAFLIVWAKGKPVTPEYKQALTRWGLPDDYPALASITTCVFQNKASGEIPAIDYLNPGRDL
jgi:broad specificity phosphatase PhoE